MFCLTDLEKGSLAACTLESPGEPLKITSVGPHPDQLKQNLWGWAQASMSFKSSQVTAKCSQVRALLLEAYLPKSSLVSGPFSKQTPSPTLGQVFWEHHVSTKLGWSRTRRHGEARCG